MKIQYLRGSIFILFLLFIGCIFFSEIPILKAEAAVKEITVSAAGDCTFSSDIKQSAAAGFFAAYEKYGPRYFFRKVAPVFRSDDLSIINFEGTLSNRGTRAEKLWAFRGKPKYARILSFGSIEAVGFANNHVNDYGPESYADTKRILRKNHIKYSSAENISVQNIKGERVVMVSVSGVGPPYHPVTRLRELLKKARKKKPAILIVSIHCGTEYANSATALQEQLAHIAVDEGKANLVLGHHPHVIQGIEKRKGATIVYSLGNFVFGGNTNPADKDTMIYRQKFTIRNGKVVIKKNKGRILPCALSSVPHINNYHPKIVKKAAKRRIIQRVNAMSSKYDVRISPKGRIL